MMFLKQMGVEDWFTCSVENLDSWLEKIKKFPPSLFKTHIVYKQKDFESELIEKT